MHALPLTLVPLYSPPHMNYHIFYYMLVGASPFLRRQLSLQAVEDYRYLSQGVVPLEDVSEVDEFHRLKRSLAMLGLTEDLQNRFVCVCVCACVRACVCVTSLNWTECHWDRWGGAVWCVGKLGGESEVGSRK